MTHEILWLLLSMILLIAGIYFLLPPQRGFVRVIGGGVLVAAFGLFFGHPANSGAIEIGDSPYGLYWLIAIAVTLFIGTMKHRTIGLILVSLLALGTLWWIVRGAGDEFQVDSTQIAYSILGLTSALALGTIATRATMDCRFYMIPMLIGVAALFELIQSPVLSVATITLGLVLASLFYVYKYKPIFVHHWRMFAVVCSILITGWMFYILKAEFLCWAVVSLGLSIGSLYLLQNPKAKSNKFFGCLLLAVAVGLLLWQATLGSAKLTSGTHLSYLITGITLVSAVGAITSRSPIYCALWFGLTLLGTAGLFLLIGAQFLSAATIVVYAGAILVTFLFVLMLANAKGSSPADQFTYESLLSATAGGMMIAVLSTTIMAQSSIADGNSFLTELQTSIGSDPAERTVPVKLKTSPATTVQIKAATTEERAKVIASTDLHVVQLGREMFTTHLLSVELAAVLLLVGLAGAIAISAHNQDEPFPSIPHPSVSN